MNYFKYSELRKYFMAREGIQLGSSFLLRDESPVFSKKSYFYEKTCNVLVENMDSSPTADSRGDAGGGCTASVSPASLL